MRITQTTTDTLDVTSFGPASLCTVNYESQRGSSVFLVASSGLATATRGRRPVDQVMKFEWLVVLRDAGLDAVSRWGVTALDPTGALPDAYVDRGDLIVTDYAVAISETLAGLSDDEVRMRTFAMHEWLGLYPLDSPVESEPLNHPVWIEVSDENVDISAARSHLESHQYVSRVVYDRGRPGSYDHIPSALYVTVTPPGDRRSAIGRDARVWYARHIRGDERFAAGPNDFELALTRFPSESGGYGDLLGLAPFARAAGSYDDPSDD